MVHGDDFTFIGDDASLRWVEELMSEWYEVKVRARLGVGDHDDKEATLLGRIVRMGGVGGFRARRTRCTESQCWRIWA